MPLMTKRNSFKNSLYFLNLHVLKYPAPRSLNYLWTFGSLLIVCFAIQIITGLFLAMFYKSDMYAAFVSVENLSRQLVFGWALRYFHANGASFFFLYLIYT